MLATIANENASDPMVYTYLQYAQEDFKRDFSAFGYFVARI